MAGALVQALIAHGRSVFQGPNGDYPAVLETLADVSAAQARWKPVPRQNSIWQKTLLELILSSGPAHEAHHGGQIDYLKGLQAR